MKPVTTVMCLLSAGLVPEAASGGGPTYIDPTSFAGTLTAKGDAVWGITDCSIGTLSNIVTCTVENFQPGDVGKTFIIDDGGYDSASGGRAPLVGTIAYVGMTSHSATLSVTATNQVGPNVHIADVDVATSGSNFTFGSNQSIGCGGTSGNTCMTSMGSLAIAAGTPAIMKVVSATTVTGGSGSGGTPNGTCTVTGSTETSFPGQAPSITVSLTGGGGIGSVLNVASGGNVVADTTVASSGGTYTEGVSGCGSLSGGQLALSYGVVLEQILPRRGYYITPPCSSSTAATMTSVGATTPGTGLTVTCSDQFTSAAAWGTDNTASFQQAISQSNVAASGGTLTSATGVGPRCVYLPEGNYLTNPLHTGASFGTTDTMMGYGCWLGDERYHSVIFVVPNVAGDLFSWLDSGFVQSLPTLGYTQYISNFSMPGKFNQAGSAVRSLTVIGDRSSNIVQNAFMFYGATNYTLVDDVVVSYMRGRALGAGMPDVSLSRGDFTESRVRNSRFDYDGDVVSGTTQTPTVDIFAQNIEGSNNVDFSDFRIYQSFGPGIWLHQSTTGGPITQNNRQLRLTNIKIEGSKVEKVQGAGGDLIEFGDPGSLSSGQNVDSILCRNVQLSNPPLGYAALHVAGGLQASTSAIDCQGSIQGGLTSGDGRGIQVDTCAGCSFEEIENTSNDYNLLVGTLSATGPASAGSCSFTSTSVAPTSPVLAYDGAGLEAKLSTCINPLAIGFVSLPARQLLAAGNVGNTGLLGPVAPVESFITSTTGTTLTVANSPLGSTTASVKTLGVNAAAPSWIALRQGPTVTFTDTLPAASTIIAALGAGASSGEQHQITLCNRTSISETVTGNATVVLNGVSVVAPNSCVNLGLVINTTAGTIAVTGG